MSKDVDAAVTVATVAVLKVAGRSMREVSRPRVQPGRNVGGSGGDGGWGCCRERSRGARSHFRVWNCGERLDGCLT